MSVAESVDDVITSENLQIYNLVTLTLILGNAFNKSERQVFLQSMDGFGMVGIHRSSGTIKAWL